MAKRKRGRIIVSNHRVKRRPSAFNKCVGRALKKATYRGKAQWKGEFKKAVKKCKA